MRSVYSPVIASKPCGLAHSRGSFFFVRRIADGGKVGVEEMHHHEKSEAAQVRRWDGAACVARLDVSAPRCSVGAWSFRRRGLRYPKLR